MRFASLGSGSSGNALVVEAGQTRVMMDCGFSVPETSRRLGSLGLAPDMLDAIVVTHEHDDHLGGVARFALRHGIQVFLTRGTARSLPEDFPQEQATFVQAGVGIDIGDLAIEPLAVPHDAREPVQYAFGDGQRRLGVVTDLGTPTEHLRERLSGLDALVLECNHDLDLLMGGPYPASLKQRVAGRFGHLSNADAARLLSSVDRSRLRHVIAAHLSRQNNRAELASEALATAMGCEASWVGIATQDGGFDWREC